MNDYSQKLSEKILENENLEDVLMDLNREVEKGELILFEQKRKNMHVLEVIEAKPYELKEAEINESAIIGKVREAISEYKEEIEALKK